MFEDFLIEFKEYAENTLHIEAVVMVGSFARGTNRENSDLDLVILSSDKSGMIADSSFVQKFGKVNKKQIEYYGACTSIRVWYEDGKEIEFGIVEPSWIEKPLDIGTKKVLSDGYQVIVDKKRYFEDIIF